MTFFQFYGDLAHGVKYIHLYVFAPCFSSPAGDYVDADGGTYQAVLTATHELGNWDDILAKSQPHAAGVKVALLFSETGDIFLDSYGTAGAAKRSLYIALSHLQLAIDILTEEDLVDGLLNNYAVLYITHAFVNDKASRSAEDWVNAGGRLVSTVNGGFQNQANMTNSAIVNRLFGLSSDHSIYIGTRVGVDARVDFIKQDLAFAEVLDTVSVSINNDTGSGNITVVGAKTIFTPPPHSTTLARFSDSSAAAFSRNVGKGKVFFFAFHLGLSYFYPAIPKQPVARGSTDQCFNHWLPTKFDEQARKLVALPVQGVVGAAPVLSSEPLVDIGVLAAANLGTVIPVTSWAGDDPLLGLNLTLQFNCDFKTATLASGNKIVVSKTASGRDSFKFDLHVADAIILR